MMKLVRILLAVPAAAMFFVAFSPSALAQVNGGCNGLSGVYSDGSTVTGIAVGADGATVNVALTDGRPNAYGTCRGGSLSVNFSDDAFVDGVFDGRAIRWANNSRWSKLAAAPQSMRSKPAEDSACTGLSGIYDNGALVVVSDDNRTVNVALNNGRPNAYGLCKGNALIVNFSDDDVFTATFNGWTISWDNGSAWTKR